MNKITNVGLIAVMLASSLGLAQADNHTPQPGVQFGGNIELDHTMTTIDPADATYSQGGRVKLEISGRRDFGEYFTAGKGELLMVNDGTTATEDAWLMLGRSKSWNLRVGHFENSHLFPEGRDTLIEHAEDGGSGNAPVPYEMDRIRGRFDGGLRLRIQSVENWLLEIGTRYGGDGDDTDVLSGIRPVAIYENDGYALRFGLETQDDGVNEMSGFGISAGIPLGGATINVNLTSLDDDANALESTTIGLNAAIGAFVIGAYSVDTDYDAGNDPTLSTVYASYSHGLMDIETLAITYAISTSSSDDVAADAADERTDARVRLNYTF